jgi:Uma2 family endonuclease
MTTVDQIDQEDELSDRKPHPGRRMTEEEFVEWSGHKTRAEWVDGEVIVMSPVSDLHGDLNSWLNAVIRLFVEQKDLGSVRGPEAQVRLASQRARREPDLLFVARHRLDILRPNHVEGAPDLMMEIVSPESMARDWREKYLEFEAGGVLEYWVIDPMASRVEAYTLGDDRHYRRLAEGDGKVGSIVLAGFHVRPQWLWQRPLPKVVDALREMGVAL